MIKGTPFALILLAVIIILAPISAGAEEFVDPHWNESPIRFSAGFKFGAAFPSSEDMKEVYGDKPIAYYNIEAGWKMVHHLELHAEISYWWAAGRGIDSDGKKTNEKYKIHLAPAELGLLYRFNFVYDQVVVPFLGIAGVYSYWMEERLDSSWKRRGGKYGLVGKGGLMFLLDNAEKRASAALERDWGINNTYLYYTYKYSNTNNFAPDKGLDLTNHAHCLGIIMEF